VYAWKQGIVRVRIRRRADEIFYRGVRGYAEKSKMRNRELFGKTTMNSL
jgi:hypothetical protein